METTVPARWTQADVDTAIRNLAATRHGRTEAEQEAAVRAVYAQATAALLDERDQIEAEVVDLRAAVEPKPTAYRLPDDLGGQAVTVESESHNGTGNVKVRTAGGRVLALQRADLVEVRPPSIDDPVTLPLAIHTAHGVVVWLQGLDSDDETTLTVGPMLSRSYTATLPSGALRELARAAWQRANEVEAKP